MQKNQKKKGSPVKLPLTMVDKSLALKLQIGPQHKAEVDSGNTKDRLVLSATIFSALVLLATQDIQLNPVKAAPAADAYKTESIIINPSNKEPSSEAGYRFLSPKAIKVISRHIAEKWNVSYIMANNIVKMADESGYQADIDPMIVLSIIATESSFDHSAKSHVGAEGLMQVWRKWHPEKFTGIDKPTTEQNILIGTAIFKEYLDVEKGSIVDALQRYNGARQDASYKYANKVLTVKSAFDSIAISHSQNVILARS